MSHRLTPEQLRLLDEAVESPDVSAEDLLDYALAGLPDPFDPERKLAPQERALGHFLQMDELQPTRVTQLDVVDRDLWEIRLADTPALRLPAATRTLKRRILRAIQKAGIAPVSALTEVFGRRGFRRFVFSTRVPEPEEAILAEVWPD